MDRYKLLKGDCLKRMKEIQDHSVDMVMVDPPYGTTACKWDSVIPLEPMWRQLQRVIKPNGAIIIMASQPFTTTLISSNLKMFKYEWIWEKTMPSGMATSSFMPMKYHENIIIFIQNSKPTFNKQLAERSEEGKKRAKTPIQNSAYKSNHIKINKVKAKQYNSTKVNPKTILRFNSVRNCSNKIHPTKEPVALMEYLIKTYTNKNELVLDFTMGSGTTGVACMNLNRKFIGIEKDTKYFQIAKKRIKKAKNKGRLY